MDPNLQQMKDHKYREMPTGGKLIIRENKLPHLPKHAGVYLLKDESSGLAYVGSASNVNKRAQQYLSRAGKDASRHLFKSVNPSNISFQLLEDCKYLTSMARIKLQDEWINKLNTIYPNGLNKPIKPRLKKNQG